MGHLPGTLTPRPFSSLPSSSGHTHLCWLLAAGTEFSTHLFTHWSAGSLIIRPHIQYFLNAYCMPGIICKMVIAFKLIGGRGIDS